MDAGKLIFENLPNDVRPKWAASILKFALARSGIRSLLLRQVLRTADNRNLWKNGHRIFSKVRGKTLNVDELARKRRLTKDEELWLGMLVLAELVAKVTYNATNPLDEFDEDSGWGIVTCLKYFVDKIWPDDEEFAKAAWLAVSSKEGKDDGHET